MSVHFGAFPAGYVPGRSHLSAAEPPVEERSAPLLSRRGWLVGVVGITGLAVGVGGARLLPGLVGSRTAREPQPPSEVERGTVEWALALLAGPPDELLQAAGDLERVSMRTRDGRLTPCFQRLLDLALERDDPHADMAGACAVRSLGRLGRYDLLEAASTRLQARTDRPYMRVDLDYELEQHRPAGK